jgi:hypothetical protein
VKGRLEPKRQKRVTSFCIFSVRSSPDLLNRGKDDELFFVFLPKDLNRGLPAFALDGLRRGERGRHGWGFKNSNSPIRANSKISKLPKFSEKIEPTDLPTPRLLRRHSRSGGVTGYADDTDKQKFTE